MSSDITGTASRSEGQDIGLSVALAASAALLLACALAALCIGRYPIAPVRALEIIAQAIASPLAPPDGVEERVVLLLRAPRVLFAMLAGAGLAVSGAALQGVFRNPLVSPQVLGISQGAALGGAVAILFGVWGLGLIVAVSGGALLALVAVGLLARIGGQTQIITVILGGMVIGSLASALISLAQVFADPNTSLPAIVYWLMGSFSTLTWERLGLAAPGMVAGCILLWLLRFRLNVLSLSDAEARTLGAHPDRERWIIFFVVAALVGSQVAVSGIVGWVGLVIPHACRLIVGEDHRRLVPMSIVCGATFMLVVDTVARTMSTSEVPLGILTAIVGAPIFGALLRHHMKNEAR